MISLLRKLLIKILLISFIATGCTKNFQSVNTSASSTTVPPLQEVFANLLNTFAVNTGNVQDLKKYFGWNIACTELISQHLSSPGGYWSWDNYSTNYDATSADGLWDYYYQIPIKGAEQILYLAPRYIYFDTQPNPNQPGYIQLPSYRNVYAIARIIKAYCTQKVTDCYGAAPYSLAGAAFYDPNELYPPFESQQQIYYSILQQLDTLGSRGFDPSGNTLDLLPDITSNVSIINNWKKTLYGVMLRVAMRLTKIQPDTAKKYVAEAYIQGGFLSTDLYNSVNTLTINTSQSYISPLSIGLGPATTLPTMYNVQTYNNQTIKASQTLVNLLRQGNGQSGVNYQADPRLFMIPVLRNQNDIELPSIAGQNFATDTASQLGYPNGTSTIPNLNTLLQYSDIRNALTITTAPVVIFTNSQTQFLLAEAAERGWLPGVTNGSTFFINGVMSAINELQLYNASILSYLPTLVLNVINQYPTSFNYLSLSKQQRIQLINTQYWLASIFQGPEAWANWRRTRAIDNPNGSPALIAPNGGSLPNRLQYPQSERLYDMNNLSQAIGIQGSDNINTRLWWDPSAGNFFNF